MRNEYEIEYDQLIIINNNRVIVAEGLSRNARYSLPIAIQLPALFYDGTNLLGMGDIVLPGFFLCFLYRYDMLIQGTPFRGYFLHSLVGYSVGLYLALIMLLATNFLSQPALIYLGLFLLNILIIFCIINTFYTISY